MRKSLGREIEEYSIRLLRNVNIIKDKKGWGTALDENTLNI